MSERSASAPFTIGEWRVDPAIHQLARDGEKIVVEPRVMEVLVYLAHHPGEVISHNELIDKIWRGSIVTESAVYQKLAKLRHALHDDPHNPRYIETIPKRGYRLIAPVEEIPWPQPVVGAPVMGRTAWLSVVGGIALLLVVAVLIFELQPAIEPESKVASVAVLPFVDLSPDGSQEHLAHGLTEEFIHVLSNVPGLRVAARSSSFAVARRELDVPAIGQALNVDTVLEGSIRRSGDRLRITVQLVDTRDGHHLWSKAYDRPSTDLMVIQQEIAKGVADVLRNDGSAEGVRQVTSSTRDLESYEYYVLARHLLKHREADELERAVDYFQSAIERDPDFARAYAGLAEAYLLLVYYSRTPRDELRPSIRSAAEQALAIDAHLAEAYVTLGALAEMERDPESATALYERAIELDPNLSVAYMRYSSVLGEFGRHREAMSAMQSARELDPLSAHVHLNSGVMFSQLGEPEQAVEHYRKAMALDPDYRGPYTVLARHFTAIGQLDEALRVLKQYVDRTGGLRSESMLHSSTVCIWLGDYEAASRWIVRSDALAPGSQRVRIHKDELGLSQAFDVGALGEAEQFVHRLTAASLDGSLRRQGRGLAFLARHEIMLDHDEHAWRLLNRIEASPLDEFSGEVDSNLFETTWIEYGMFPAVYLAFLHLERGEETEAQQLLERSKDTISGSTLPPFSTAGAHYLMASIAALEGDFDTSLARLRNAVEAGWRRGWLTARDPVFSGLHSDVRFDRIVDDIETDLAAQRARLKPTTAHETG